MKRSMSGNKGSGLVFGSARGRGMVVLMLACAQVSVMGQVNPPAASQPSQTSGGGAEPSPQPSPGVPGEGVRGTNGNGTNGATSRPGRLVSTTQGGGILMNFKDASIDSVLDQLSESAGFIVVRQSSVS